MKNKRKYPLYISKKDAKKARAELYQKKVKGKVPQAGPARKKLRPPDSFYSDAKAISQACQLHEDFKPLRWQGWDEYKKAIYDPDPNLS